MKNTYNLIFLYEQLLSEATTRKLIITSKDKQLKKDDDWKNKIIDELNNTSKPIEIDFNKYEITYIDYFNNDNEKKLKDMLECLYLTTKDTELKIYMKKESDII